MKAENYALTAWHTFKTNNECLCQGKLRKIPVVEAAANGHIPAISPLHFSPGQGPH